MSRPPRPRRATSTTQEPLPGRSVLDYLPHEMTDFVEMERTLAAEELGFPPTTSEGDFAGTLMEVSALISHVLGVYQDRFANEAFLGTAQSPKSLVKHGRRLAYEPSPGLAATGHLVLWAKENLDGTILQGFGVGSAPIGEKKAQDYETLADVAIDAAYNELFPSVTTETLSFKSSTNTYTLEIEGTGYELVAGEHIVLQWGTGVFTASTFKLSAHEIADVEEIKETSRTRLTFTTQVVIPDNELANVKLLAKPAERHHLFGWDSSVTTFPDVELQTKGYLDNATVPASNGASLFGYTQPSWISDSYLFLDGEVSKSIDNTPVIRVQQAFGGSPLAPTTIQIDAFKITGQTKTAVAFKWITNQTITINTSPATVVTNYPTASISGTVTGLQIKDAAGNFQNRSTQQIRASQWLFDFKVEADVVTTRPSTTLVSQPLTLATAASDFGPGRLVALSTLEDATTTLTEIVRLVTVDVGTSTTSITWENVDPTTGSGSFTLGTVRVLGNVVEISHGKTVTEVLGGSDGISPYQRFSLAKTPLTYLPSAEGGTPALDVRVSDVLWERVVDFESSGENDRVYLLSRDEAGVITVVFGDGKKGAIPGSGKKNIEASYRVGVGVDGNVAAGLVSRIKKAHPVLDRAYNPLVVDGGADPAKAEGVRKEATGYVKTLDRAVSVEDYQNLALMYPGIVRAKAHYVELGGTSMVGIELVVANAEGIVPDATSLKKFLDARRDTTISLDIVGPVAVDITMKIHLEVDSAYDEQLVKLAVVNALVGTDEDAPGILTFLGRDLGQPLFFSQVTELIQGIEGVAYVRVFLLDLLSLANDLVPRALDTVIIDPNEWIRLQPSNLYFEPLPSEGNVNAVEA